MCAMCFKDLGGNALIMLTSTKVNNFLFGMVCVPLHVFLVHVQWITDIWHI